MWAGYTCVESIQANGELIIASFIIAGSRQAFCMAILGLSSVTVWPRSARQWHEEIMVDQWTACEFDEAQSPSFDEFLNVLRPINAA